MPNCEDCKDTGVIETGNNDLPCHCPAGRTALFNTADDPLTGLDIIMRRKTPLPKWPEPVQGTMRLEYGHVFIWQELEFHHFNHSDGEGIFFRGHWQTTSGNLVRVFPPFVGYGYWTIYINDAAGEDTRPLCGYDAEARAFCGAEVYSRQRRTPRE
jgi:hypothetical protein